jgi:hypothetical protein
MRNALGADLFAFLTLAPLHPCRHSSGEADPDGRVYDNYISNIPPTPQFAFGFGLSYTTFNYSALVGRANPANVSAPVEVTFTLQNNGSRDGEEVVQIFVQDPPSWQFGQILVRPWKRLAAFLRVPLRKGEEKEVDRRSVGWGRGGTLRKAGAIYGLDL